MYFGAAFFLASGSDVLAQRLRFNATMKTTDLIDKYEDALSIVNIAAYQHYGTKREFHGKVITIQCFEDNTKAKALLETEGDGGVLVIDGGASYGRALMGDNVAAIAIKNGWEGVIINGYIRDVADINHMPIGVVALGSTPRRPKKNNDGESNITLSFAGAKFVPGTYVYVDDDGMLLSATKLFL
jgi:regulator of ribonuclease activity A